MKRKLILDPWVLEGIFASFDADRLDLIRRFSEEIARDPTSEPVAVLNADFHDRFHSSAPRSTKKLMLRWLSRMVRESKGPDQATVLPMPSDVSDAWKESLFEACAPDECESWRSATLIVPAARAHQWPSSNTTAILGLAGPADRGIARLEVLDEHPDYRHDVNPWLFRACANKKMASMVSSSSHPCRLPVPPELLPDGKHQDEPNILGYPLDQWDAQLAKARNSGWLRAGYAYFIPPSAWTGPRVPRAQWRKRGVFPTGTKCTVKGIKSGPIDYAGQVWWWDVQEHHWDVQDADPQKPSAYVTIAETGVRLR